MVGLRFAGVSLPPPPLAAATATPAAATPAPMPTIAPVESPPDFTAAAAATFVAAPAPAAPVPEASATESATTAPVTRMTFATSSLLKPGGTGACPSRVRPIVSPSFGVAGPMIGGAAARSSRQTVVSVTGGAYSGVLFG